MPKNLFEDDVWLEQKLRDANPFPDMQEQDLDERALQDLASIVGLSADNAAVQGESPKDQPGRMFESDLATDNVVPLNRKTTITRRWVLGGLAAAAAAVLVAVPLGSSLNGPTKALAAPLPLTAVKPTELNTQEAVAQLIAAVDDQPDPADFKPGHLDVEHWEAGMMFVPFDEKYLDTEATTQDPDALVEGIEGHSDDRVSIPVRYEVRRESDDSGSFKSIVGEPFSTTGEAVEYVPFFGNQKPGSATTRTVRPGEPNPLTHVDQPERTADDFYNRIQSSLRPDSAEVYDGSQGFVQTVGFMMQDWKLDQEQTKALLGAIRKLEGMEVLGTTTDRWNREAMVFGVDTRRTEGGTYRTMLLFNPETGRLTNYSEEYLTDKNPAETPDFDTDTVVRYIAVSE